MLANIVDQRKNNKCGDDINVVMEPTWHDNTCKDADQYPMETTAPSIQEKYNISLADAIEWANEYEVPMTLYLYDKEHDPMKGVKVEVESAS